MIGVETIAGQVSARLGASAVLALLCLAAVPAHADPVADFYRGKTVHVLVGVGAGGDYDVHARLLARYIGRHIPGNPAVITENMTGAGGLKMANYLYELAPKDGSYFGVIGNYLPALQAAGGRGPQFDAGRFNWLGSLTRESQTMAVWHTTGAKTVADATRREIVAGASARGAITYSFPAMMNTFFGTRFRIVTGYSGGNDINLAMERGEVEARTNSWQSWKVNRAHWLRDGKIAIIAYGGHRTSELSHVPMLADIARNDEDRQVLRLLTLGPTLGRPFAAPPDVPVERIAALRAAFAAAARDPELLAEIAPSGMELDPVGGEETHKLIANVLNTPRTIAERAREYLQ
jgi:tripartite-type tricarboxylate transporter receptor subunit TctC